MKLNQQAGFSLIELMVVVTTIGIVAMLGIPAFQKSTRRAEAITIANDMNKFVQAVELYSTSEGAYPLTMNYTTMPQQVSDYLPGKWKNGYYVWQYYNFGYLVAMVARNLNFTAEQAITLDSAIDDGNISTGNLRIIPNGMIYFFHLNLGS